MKRLLLACMLCAACKTSSSASATAHTETSTVTDSTSSEKGVQTTWNGPETDLSLIFEMPPDAGSAATPAAAPAPAAARRPTQRIHLTGKPSDLAAILDALPHGPLTGATLSQKGASTTQATQEGKGATETHAATKGDATATTEHKAAPALSCAFAGWMWGVAVIVGIVGLLLGALKMRKSV